MKAEPESRIEKGKDVKFSIDDLEALRDVGSPWDGVRNHQAKNIMKSMQLDDSVLFYHSNTKRPGVAGLAKVARLAYPDFTAFDSSHPYYDEKSKEDKPSWYMVDVVFVSKFDNFVSLKALQALAAMDDVPDALKDIITTEQLSAIKAMDLLSRGRLSVQRVDQTAYDAILALSKTAAVTELAPPPRTRVKTSKQDREETEEAPAKASALSKSKRKAQPAQEAEPARAAKAAKKAEESTKSTPVMLSNLLVAFCAVLVYTIVSRYYIKPHVLSPFRRFRGPASSSLLLGNLKDLINADVAQVHRDWVQRFGKVFRISATLAEERIFLADHKAIAHLLIARPYDYPKTLGKGRFIGKFLSGGGVLLAEGDAHKRQRKIVNPSFAPSQIRALFPIFAAKAALLAKVWKTQLECQESDVIDVSVGLNNATLDIIGAAGFGWDFSSLTGDLDDLGKSFKTIVTGGGSEGAKESSLIVRLVLLRYMPWLLHAPTQAMSKLRQALDNTNRQFAKIYERACANSRSDVEDKDLMSQLIKANADDSNKGLRMSQYEVLGQIGSFALAGHETGATSLTWTLHLLANDQALQGRLRDEVAQLMSEDELDSQALDELPLLDAVTKETMRLLPPLPSTQRVASKDDVIPLAKGNVDRDGKAIEAISVKRGQEILVSISAFNVDPEVWGDDAAEFRPDRWTDGKAGDHSATKGMSLLYGNMLTFLAGPRSCIGYKMALLEYKALLAILLHSFRFDDAGHDMIKRTIAVAKPYVKGEDETRMPLRLCKIV
ncbi:hypothetical protein E5Q_00307 [Mixia osmundae IAM 14324]|uniref:EVE domain-containing protein n=1 Tax=Mixia osmundae (strain CBS 9802 / IAM 14324 / JCM 22182 / KY 12970) TaxID=764103 RepID=G7DSV2_MIXOS|nr:hypothetical protein E5Q_00307 [Mixia osmundae IAM 14324]